MLVLRVSVSPFGDIIPWSSLSPATRGGDAGLSGRLVRPCFSSRAWCGGGRFRPGAGPRGGARARQRARAGRRQRATSVLSGTGAGAAVSRPSGGGYGARGLIIAPWNRLGLSIGPGATGLEHRPRQRKQ